MASPSLFASRRKPKRVAGRTPDEGDDEDTESGPVVRKPTSSTPRTKSKLRLSFNPAEAGTHGDEVVEKRRPAASLLRQSDISQAAERPSYSKDYLSELRNSTPTTPRDLSAYASSAEAEDDLVLDIDSKFGPQPPASASKSHIPSATEISEKKARRARLAKEQGSEASDFIPLEDYDSDGEFKPQRMQVSTFLEKEKDTRLVRDDEDIAEGFEAFVDDAGSNKVMLSRKSRREQERKEKESLRAMIDEAEDSSEGSDSSAEQNYAYETAQTSHGMDGLSLKSKAGKRPPQPREITPIPKLAAVLARFREGIQGLEFERVRLEKRQADLQRETVEIASREENIQRLLVETGKKFEQLRREAEQPSNGENVERGLESLSGTLT